MELYAKTTAGRRRELGLLLGLISMLMMCGVAVAFAYFTDWTGQEALSIMLIWALLMCMAFMWVSWLRNLDAAGPVLADFGARPNHRWVLALAGLTALFSIQDLIRLETYDLASVSDALPSSVCTVYFFYLGLLRVQIREHGIMAEERFLPWSQIVAYRWTGESGLVLQVQEPAARALVMRDGLAVPAVLKETIEARLQAGRSGGA